MKSIFKLHAECERQGTLHGLYRERIELHAKYTMK